MEEARGADQQWLPRRDDGTVERFFAARSTATTTNRGLFAGIFSFDQIFSRDDSKGGAHKKMSHKNAALRGRPWKKREKKMTDAGNTDEENPYEIVVDEEDKGTWETGTLE